MKEDVDASIDYKSPRHDTADIVATTDITTPATEGLHMSASSIVTEADRIQLLLDSSRALEERPITDYFMLAGYTTPLYQAVDTNLHHELHEDFRLLCRQHVISCRPTPLRPLYRHARFPGSEPTFEEDASSDSSMDPDMPALIEATVPVDCLPRQEVLPEMASRAKSASPSPQMKEHGEELF